MDPQELKNVLELHRKWATGEEGGARANLRSADLGSANLYGANLYGADLGSANLRSANLRSANLRSADLGSANLRSADLFGADLYGADLRSADLGSIIEDFNEVLAIAKHEVVGLYDAIMRGRIDGHEKFNALTVDLKPDSSRPSEIWFMGIRPGDTPENSQISRLTAEWIEAFAKTEGIALPKYRMISSFDHPELFEAKP